MPQATVHVMTPARDLGFDHPDLMAQLMRLDDAALDELGFGVIGFGKEADARVVRYNATERQGSGLETRQVLGLPLFSVVAQCMNNFLVAQKFDDAVAAGQVLDTALDFTFTLRMKPTPVRLRLLSHPDSPTQYIAVRR
jgi:photoactive yellow protein